MVLSRAIDNHPADVGEDPLEVTIQPEPSPSDAVGENDKSVDATVTTSETGVQTDDPPLRRRGYKSVGIQVCRPYVTKDVGCSPLKLGTTSKKKLSFSPSPCKTSWVVTENFTDTNVNAPRTQVESVIEQLCCKPLVTVLDPSYDCSSSEGELDDDDSYRPTLSVESSNPSSVDSSLDERSSQQTDAKKWKEKSLKRTRYYMECSPRLYLGVITESMSVIDLIAYKIKLQSSKVTARDVICLILRKIRLNEPFEILAHEFGISSAYASRLFRRYVSFVADHLRELIIWPTSDQIKKMLPVPFRKNYNKVESIVDCFEIQIEKPSDPVYQALTWSEYKKGNTVKYFISLTPDGLINFVSKGYGGRISDEMITSVCGYLEQIPHPDVHVMADRGFKKIEPLLNGKKCVLVRPASVKSGTKLDKSDVLSSRKIAALRIHVERGISRIREFKFLTPHATLDNKQLRHVDDVMYIVCGLINLQGPLIK